MIWEIAAIVFILAAYSYFKWRLPENYPPTPPIRIPFLGHTPYFLGYKNLQVGFNEIFKKYNRNGVLCLHIGANIRMVMLSNFNDVKNAFKNPDLNYRLAHDFSIDYCKNIYGGEGIDGVLWSYGQTWTEQRRFMLSTLRDFGFGKSGMEDIIQDEVQLFCEFLDSFDGKAISIVNLFNVGILNVLWRIVAGSRYDYRDPTLTDLTKKVNDAILATNLKPSIAALFPFLRKIFPKIDHTQEIAGKIKSVHDFLHNTVREHQRNFEKNKNDYEVQDFIEAYLKRIDEERDNPATSFNVDNLFKTLLDLFFAGSETTSSTLSWGVLHLVRNPDIQKRVQDELDRVLDGRLPSMMDKVRLPYTEAVIAEIQRIGNIAPMGVPHATFAGDVDVAGYKVPKGHVVSAHLTGIFFDEKYFGKDTSEFNPSRFLSKDEKFLKNEHLIPFLIGKRSCPGESLAKVEIFIFLITILQKYFIVSANGKKPSTDFISGITSVPVPFDVKLIPRKPSAGLISG